MALTIIQKGCAPSNHRAGRPSHLRVEAVVIHVVVGSQAACDATFLDNALTLKRSAHYCVGKDGTIHQYVDEADTAFHCGVVDRPTWSGLKRGPDGRIINPNFYTIGIEHEGMPDDVWPEAMYAASAELLRGISGRYQALARLSRANVVMHREIRASKTCPGSQADLDRLIREAAGSPPLAPRVVRARSRLNVRHGQPSTTAPVVRVIPEGELINIQRSVNGQSVQGISVWHQNMDDDFIWAGAVED